MSVFEHVIGLLAEESGYSDRFLSMRWCDYVDECLEAGEDPSVWYFVGVTLEKDW